MGHERQIVDERRSGDHKVHCRRGSSSVQKTGLQLAELFSHFAGHIQNGEVTEQVLETCARLSGAFARSAQAYNSPKVMTEMQSPPVCCKNRLLTAPFSFR